MKKQFEQRLRKLEQTQRWRSSKKRIVPTKHPKTRRGRIRHMSIGSVTRGSQSAVAGMVGSARTTVSGG